MNEIVTTIIMGLVTAVVLPLIGLASTALIKWIRSKTNNSLAENMLVTASSIIVNAVMAVFQTYVDSLKKNGEFSPEAHLIALCKARDIAISQMSDDVKKFITDTYGDLESWITTKIEATIGSLKSSTKIK